MTQAITGLTALRGADAGTKPGNPDAWMGALRRALASMTGQAFGRDAADTPADSDDALMGRTAAGEIAAFEALAARHMRRAAALAQRLTGNASDADEIAQDAFLRVWQQAPRWDGRRARFTTWLYRIVVNLAIDRRRRAPPWRPLDEAGDPVDTAPDAVERIAERQTAERLEEALQHLPDRQRAAVVLFHQEGLTLRQAAEVMGIGETAFESLLARGRQSLRASLGSGREE